MCAGPFLPGTVIRKKSPKPTRYIRTRMEPVPAPAPGPVPDPFAGVDLRAAALAGAFAGALRAVLREVLAAAFLAVLAAVLRVAMINIPRVPGQSWPESELRLSCCPAQGPARSHSCVASARAVSRRRRSYLCQSQNVLEVAPLQCAHDCRSPTPAPQRSA